MRYGESGLTRTDTIVRRSSYGPPVSAISSGGRRSAAAPSSASGFWSNEKMKYDFGLTSPSRLSVSADSSNAMPGAEEILLQHRLGRNLGEPLDQVLDERATGLGGGAHRGPS